MQSYNYFPSYFPSFIKKHPIILPFFVFFAVFQFIFHKFVIIQSPITCRYLLYVCLQYLKFKKKD